jgi:hypothetical protein
MDYCANYGKIHTIYDGEICPKIVDNAQNEVAKIRKHLNMKKFKQIINIFIE